jgi:hypothetical protein|uniref:Bacteriophage Gp15 protein n=1 Tax=Siphoviridae sp. ctX926 TaxID=2826366 RepID=A0A8S5M1I0_9CAUD|nr:MAG TPA: hypothetical protein [Siphoviridae sp. ctX926]
MILKKPPTTLKVGGKDYEIDTDFRTIIEVENMIFGNLTEEQEAFAKEIRKYSNLSAKDAELNARYFYAMQLFYKGIMPDDLEEATEKLIWFYSCGKKQKGSKPKEPTLSFENDMDYINAGFLQDYGIDLFDIDYMHWWKFMSLFSALHDNCKICEIMGWRGADLSKMNKEQRKYARQMKKLYAIPVETRMSKKEIELQKAIDKALMEGGDVSSVLRKFESEQA